MNPEAGAIEIRINPLDPGYLAKVWLRELVFSSHPLGDDMVDGADTWNGDRFRQCLPENS